MAETSKLPEEDRPDIKPDLPGLRDAEEAGGTGSAKPTPGYYNPSGDSAGEGGSASSPGALNDKEHDAGKTADGQVGAGYNPDEKHSRGARARKYLGRNKKKIGIGGGIGLGIVGGGIGLFLLLLPLKVEHMVRNLEHHFFASSENAIQKQTRKMFEQYVIKHVLPSYGRCGTSTINRTCSVRIAGKGPVSNLYRSWANARIENNLAKNYGIEFERKGGTWRVKYPGSIPDGENIGNNGEKLEDVFDRQSTARPGALSKLDDALEKETRWKKTYYRYKVGRLLEEKYGIRRCIIFCGVTDPINDQIDLQKKAAKLYIANRVLLPQNEIEEIAIECIISGCDATTARTADDNVPAADGQRTNDNVDKEIGAKVRAFAEANNLYSADAFNALEKTTQEYEDKGFLKVFVSKKVASIVDWIGVADFVARFINTANNAGPNIKKLGYIVNAYGAVKLYQTYSTYADEIHTGHVKPTEVGSWTNTLGSGDHGTKNDPQVGGTAGAEQTPLYQNLLGDNQPSKNVSLLQSILPSRAYAETSGTGETSYKCNDGKPVPGGKLVCGEENFGGGNQIANSIHDFLNSGDPIVSTLTNISAIYVNTFGKVVDAAGNFVAGAASLTAGLVCDTTILGVHIPPPPPFAAMCALKDIVEKETPKILDAIVKLIIPSPLSSNMSGGRTFDMMAAGADVAGNDAAHVKLGARQLKPSEVATILDEQQAEDQQNFDRQSVFARMFDTDSSNSLVSKLAMQIPFGKQAQLQSGFASISNPLGSLSHGLASIFSMRAIAASQPQNDPFGVVQYGYAGEIPKDPENYWNKYCSDDPDNAYQSTAGIKQFGNWNDKATHALDPNTQEPVNHKTNACLLIKTTVGAAGGIFDKSNLTDDDLALGGRADASSSDTNTGAIPSDAQQLAQEIMKSGRLTDQDGRYIAQIRAVAQGDFSCNVNPDLLKMLYGVVVQDGHRVVMSSLNRRCTGVLTASGAASYHYRDGGGHAVDVVGFDGKGVDGGHNAGTLGYLDEAVKFLPRNAGFGQNTCGSGFKVPSGDYSFYDTCNHQHIQVPVKQLSK